jgi:sulfite exporter TauE/SafE
MSLYLKCGEILAGVTATMTTGQAVFGATIMASVAYVTLPIPRLVCVKVVERRFSAPRQRSNVAVMRIIAVVDVAVEAVRAVKPRASADKHPASEPIGSIVAVGSTVIGRIVEVPIGAHRGHSNVDGNLGWRYG